MALPRKATKGDLQKKIRKLTQDNHSLGIFCEGLINMVKAVHAESAKEYERLGKKLSPSARRSRSVFGGICKQLGPYCLDVMEEKPELGVPELEVKKGDDNASNSEESQRKEPDSGVGHGEDSGNAEG